MKHDDLWNDALKDALPPDVQSQSLAAMKREASRLRARRRLVRVSAGAAVASLVFVLAKHTLTDSPAPRVQIAEPSAALAQRSTPHVRYLSNEELIARLRDAGIGIGVAGSGEEKQILLVSRDGEVCRP